MKNLNPKAKSRRVQKGQQLAFKEVRPNLIKLMEAIEGMIVARDLAGANTTLTFKRELDGQWSAQS